MDSSQTLVYMNLNATLMAVGLLFRDNPLLGHHWINDRINSFDIVFCYTDNPSESPSISLAERYSRRASKFPGVFEDYIQSELKKLKEEWWRGAKGGFKRGELVIFSTKQRRDYVFNSSKQTMRKELIDVSLEHPPKREHDTCKGIYGIARSFDYYSHTLYERIQAEVRRSMSYLGIQNVGDFVSVSDLPSNIRTICTATVAGDLYFYDRYQWSTIRKDFVYPRNLEPYIMKSELNQSIDSQQTKESNMSQISINTLLQLADTQTRDDLAEFGINDLVPDQFKEALRAEQEREREEANRSAAKEVVGLLKVYRDMITDHVQALAQLRRREKILKAEMKKLNQAARYGQQTNNFVPLAAMLDVPGVHRVIDPALTKIPESFMAEEQGQNKPSAKATKKK